MSVPVVLPPLGENVSEATVTRWLKREGDSVRVDEPLLEISTDKVDTEVLSPVEGTIASILITEEKTATIGDILALVHPPGTADLPGDDRGSVPAADAIPASSALPSATQVLAPPVVAPSAPQPAPPPAELQPSPVPATVDRSFLTPLVRKLARDLGVDLTAVVGTGAGGRIRAQDVRTATAGAPPVPMKSAAPATPSATPPAAAPTAAPSPSTARGRSRTESLSRLRKVIATRMVDSLHVSAQLTSTLEADLTAVVELRQRVKDEFAAREGVGLSVLPFVALAAIEALRVHPMLNASVDLEAGTATYHSDVNLGIAVDTDRGLLAPVISGADELNVAGLAHRIADLAARARTNNLTVDELSAGTFTITNTGSRGALFDTPILNQPQVGILGIGATVRRPVVVPDTNGGESIAIRSMAFLSLTYDHRLVDGADAARYLSTVKQRLEAGQFAAEVLPALSPSTR